MGKPFESTIDRFDGGIVSDARDPRENTCRVVSNFDVLTNPRKLIPERDLEAGESLGSTRFTQNFCVALRTGTTYSLYGYARQVAVNRVNIIYKDISNGGSADLGDNLWTNTSNNEGGIATPNYDLFAYYKKTGYIYGGHGGTQIWRYDPTGSGAFVDSHQALTYTELTQGIVHSKDDILYFGYFDSAAGTTAIAKNNNGSWTTAALTLPNGYKPTCVSEFGDFLAIAIVPTSGEGNSRVLLWDRDSSLATVTANIDFGSGELRVLKEVNGDLIGISLRGSNSAVKDRVYIRRYLGGNRVEKIKEIVEDSVSSITLTLLKRAQKIDDRLYFMMAVYLNGAIRDGVWSIGRSDAGWTLVHERSCNNDTALAVGDTLRGFFILGDYKFMAFVVSGTHTVTKSDNQANYLYKSVYESKTFNAGDSSLKKDLVGVTVRTEYLPAAGQIVLQYRTDHNTSWTTLFTNTTDNSISHSMIKGGNTLPGDYKEIQFRIESTGGAEVTALSFKEDITGKRLY